MTVTIKIFSRYDPDPDRKARNTIGPALHHAANHLNKTMDIEWLDNQKITPAHFKTMDGAFIAPGHADEEMAHILDAISYARTHHIPCLGTCGGFQRIIAEFAVNVLGFINIAHQEVDPDASAPLFSSLHCALEAAYDKILIKAGTQAHALYQCDMVMEKHFCNFGLNPIYETAFTEAGLHIAATDVKAVARIMELAHHPFFVGTLFVPQAASTPESPHPIVKAFVAEAARQQKNSTERN